MYVRSTSLDLYFLRKAPNELGVQRAGVSQLIHPLRALCLQVHQYLCGVAVGERESTKECIARSRFHRQVAGETTCLPAVAGLRRTRRPSHADDSSRCTGRPA